MNRQQAKNRFHKLQLSPLRQESNNSVNSFQFDDNQYDKKSSKTCIYGYGFDEAGSLLTDLTIETNDSQNDYTECTEKIPENFYPDLPDASPESIPKWFQENTKITHLTKEIQYPEKEIPNSDAHEYFTVDFLALAF